MSTLLITLLLCGLFTWLGLPAMLRALGLHPHYIGPVYALPGKRALIITQTPQHPERELRAAGVETAQTMLRLAGGLPRPWWGHGPPIESGVTVVSVIPVKTGIHRKWRKWVNSDTKRHRP